MSLYPELNSFVNNSIKSEIETKTINMSLSLEIAEKMLIRFDGNKNKLYEFIDNCDKAMSLIKPELKAILFAIIETKLTDKARAITRNRNFLEWIDLKKFLLDAYSERRTEGQWQLELHSLRQLPADNVITFSNKVENCYIKLLNTLDSNLSREAREACTTLLKNQALNVFIRGLNKDISILLKSRNPNTLEEAVALALAEEQEQLSNLEIQKQVFCNICKRNNHSTANCRYKNDQNKNIRHFQNLQNNYCKNQNSSKFSNNYHNNGQHSNVRNESSQKFCRYCKKPGHLIENCRKREYNNSKARNPPDRSQNRINYSQTNEPKFLNSYQNKSSEHNQHLNYQQPRQQTVSSRGVQSVQAVSLPSTSQSPHMSH